MKSTIDQTDTASLVIIVKKPKKMPLTLTSMSILIMNTLQKAKIYSQV